MTRRSRQGWRVPIVSSRSVVAGLLLVISTPLIPEPSAVFAQTEPDRTAQPPPLPSHGPAGSREPVEATPAVQQHRPPLPPDRDIVGPTPSVTPEGIAPALALPVPPSVERLTTRRISLNQILYRDRRHQLLLSRGDEALSSGDMPAAVINFQALVDAERDAFFWPVDSLQPQGAQCAAQLRLQQLSATDRAAYEQRFGPVARALLSDILATDEHRMTLDLLRRYPHTAAGREAMIGELLTAFDGGELVRAAELARRLSADVHHWRALSTDHQALVRQVERRADAWEHRQAQTPATAAAASQPAFHPVWTATYRGLLASDGGQPAGEISPSELSHGQLSETIAVAINDWAAERREQRIPVATANQPLVVGDLLVVRDYAGVRALGLSDGQTRWHFPCDQSLTNTAAQRLRRTMQGGGASPLNVQIDFAGDSVRGQLATDGRRVFFVDGDSSDVPDAADTPTEEPLPAPTNCLVAVTLAASTSPPQPLWIRGTDEGERSNTLTGHYFLGPPLPIDGRLFVLTECDGRLDCVALAATTGALLWQQPVGLAEPPLAWDRCRLRLGCTPLYARSLVICPTEVGVVVGLDALTGVLRWVYDHLDDDQRLASGRWSASAQRHFGSAELPSRTILCGERLYHLPFRSQFVHCLEPSTGRLLWKADRNDAIALTAATEEAVVLLGRRDTVALSPDDGSVRWRAATPEPAGHGLLANDHYLLPLADGRCLPISLDDGRLGGSPFGNRLHALAQPTPAPAPGDASPQPVPSAIQLVSNIDPALEDRTAATVPTRGGNLLAAGEHIVISTPLQVALLPQSDARLRQLTAARTTPLSSDEELQVAMLSLQIDDRAPARERLQELVASCQDPDVTSRATHLLRALLFAELAEASNPWPVLDQLEQLPQADADRLQLLVGRIDAALRTEDISRLTQALDAFRAADVPTRLELSGEDSYTVSATDYVADQLALCASTATPETAAALDAYLQQVMASIAGSGHTSHRHQLVALFDHSPRVAPWRNDTAEEFIAAGQLQQAELLLLRNCAVEGSQPSSARAHQLLADLYASQELDREAAVHLAALVDRPEGSVADMIPALRRSPNGKPRENRPWAILRRRRAEPAPAYDVRIEEHVCDETCESVVRCRAGRALEHHDRIRRKFLLTDDSSLMIVDRGVLATDRNHSRITLLSRESGGVHAELDIPATFWQLATSGDGACGQLLPICGRAAYGVSLLEKRTLWTHGPSQEGSTRDKIKIGPIGPQHCVLQTRDELSVIDPATGELKWSRGDLSTDVGLFANEITGIIGDGELLTLFDTDQISYTVYRTRSGQRVRTGRLDVTPDAARQYRRACGSMLVQVVAEEAGHRFCLWSAATNELLMSQPLMGQLFSPTGRGSEYALVTADGRLVVVDVPSASTRLDLPLPPESLQDVTDLAVTSDPDHYFVNLVHCQNHATEETVAAMDELEIPCLRVQGELLAVSRQGRLLWSHMVTDSALVTQSDCRLPVLLFVSRVRDPQQRQFAHLRIDVHDVRTGQLLTRRQDLLRTRYVHMHHWPQGDQVTLVGLDAEVDISFGPSRQEFLIHAEVSPPQRSEEFPPADSQTARAATTP